METGERVSQHMFHLHPKPQSAYVILSNTFMQFWEIGEEDEYEKQFNEFRGEKKIRVAVG